MSSSLAANSIRQQTASSDASSFRQDPQQTTSQGHSALTHYHNSAVLSILISTGMDRTCSPAMAFASEGCYPPQATISLSQTLLMTPEPQSPESYYSIKEEHIEGEESNKPTKKRKSWGQELPTPKTNLPPRYTFSQALLKLAMLIASSGNEQRQRMRRNNVVSSESFEIVKPLNHHESESDKKSRSSRARKCPSNNKMSVSKSD